MSVRAGDMLRLPSGVLVAVDRVDRYSDRTVLVHYEGGQLYRAPIVEPARRGRRRELVGATR